MSGKFENWEARFVQANPPMLGDWMVFSEFGRVAIMDGRGDADDRVNAMLAACAPQLWLALDDLYRHVREMHGVDGGSEDLEGAMFRAETILAKARGGEDV